MIVFPQLEYEYRIMRSLVLTLGEYVLAFHKPQQQKQKEQTEFAAYIEKLSKELRDAPDPFPSQAPTCETSTSETPTCEPKNERNLSYYINENNILRMKLAESVRPQLGCICPPGSGGTCRGLSCPRKGVRDHPPSMGR